MTVKDTHEDSAVWVQQTAGLEKRWRGWWGVGWGTRERSLG